MDCRSFYLQIAGCITAEILSCQLRPGQQMQSIRRLSVYSIGSIPIRFNGRWIS